MKFLENEKLSELTAQLSDAVLGQSHRVIDGRIEAYTMKRAGNDKKFAHTLGQKYIADLEEQQQLLADLTQSTAATPIAKTSTGTSGSTTSSKNRKKRSNSATSVMEALGKKPRHPARIRSQSVDVATLSSNKTTLGDFSALATRRLMTDLILTLNATFPDYDFSNAKPQQFEKLSIETVRRRIYERLSELASYRRMSSRNRDWLMELWMAVNDVIELKECDVYSFEDETLLEDHRHNNATLWSFHYFFVNKSLRRLVFFTCSEKIEDSSTTNNEEQEMIVMMPSEVQMDTEVDLSDNNEGDVLAGGGMSIPISNVH
jgi:hypothetical protein